MRSASIIVFFYYNKITLTRIRSDGTIDKPSIIPYAPLQHRLPGIGTYTNYNVGY